MKRKMDRMEGQKGQGSDSWKKRQERKKSQARLSRNDDDL